MKKISSPRHLRRQARLQLLVAEAGSPTELARLANSQRTHISALIHGKQGLGDELAAKLESAMGKPPGWLDGVDPIPSMNDPHPGGEDQPSVAQSVSHLIPIVTPQTLIWGALVLSDIKGEFIMAVAGDALAPYYLPGVELVWEACDFGRPGKAVLLVDQAGGFHLRIYQPRISGSWAGVSEQIGHPELQPERDGVRIVARSKWRSED